MELDLFGGSNIDNEVIFRSNRKSLVYKRWLEKHKKRKTFQAQEILKTMTILTETIVPLCSLGSHQKNTDVGNRFLSSLHKYVRIFFPIVILKRPSKRT